MQTMKKILNNLSLIFVFLMAGPVSLLAQGKWEGTWTTNQGTVYLVQGGGFVYGVFDNRGYIFGRVAAGGNRIAGTYTDEIAGTPGRFEWTMSSGDKSFTGLKTYGEEFKVLNIDNSTEWKASKKGNENLTRKTVNSNNGATIFRFVQSPNNRYAGTEVSTKKAIYGKIVGNVSQNGKISPLDATGKRTGESGSLLAIAQAMPHDAPAASQPAQSNSSGATSVAQASRPVTQSVSAAAPAQKPYKLRITWNSIKMNKANFGNSTRGYLWFTTKVDEEGVGAPAANWKTVGRIGSNNVYYEFKVGVDVRKTNHLDIVINESIAEIQQKNIKLSNQIDFHWGIPLQYVEILAKNNLAEILKFLTRETQASDYSDAVHGRKRLPNSHDTFWLETSGGKRYVRGYGDLIPRGDKVRFGYHYTLELID